LHFLDVIKLYQRFLSNNGTEISSQKVRIQHDLLTKPSSL